MFHCRAGICLGIHVIWLLYLLLDVTFAFLSVSFLFSFQFLDIVKLFPLRVCLLESEHVLPKYRFWLSLELDFYC